MPSLFAKIFLAFFLTVVLLGVLLELSAMRTELRRVDEVFRPLAEQKAPHLADAFEQQGAGGLAAEIRRLPVPAVLTDEHGESISAVPPPLSPAVDILRSLVDGGEHVSEFAAWRNFAIQPAVSSSRRHYFVVFGLPHERWIAILNTLDQYPALRLSLVAVVAGVICVLLARHITRPLVRLRTTAGQMADGRLDARAGPAFTKRRDEIGALGRDFDVMADRVSALVTSQRRLLADVSHELRSPLARLTVALGLARQHAGDGTTAEAQPALVAADLARMELEIERLDRLIGQSLALARLDTGVESGTRETFDLTNLVEQVAADGDYEARASGCRVAVTAADACTMSGLADLIRSAIENVVRNAIRHTAPGTTVDVSLRAVANGPSTFATVHIRDHGPGIPSELLSEIFLPFRRVPSVEGSTTTGSGLGLAIAERVMRLHGGRIAARNADAGGLDVEMILPLS